MRLQQESVKKNIGIVSHRQAPAFFFCTTMPHIKHNFLDTSFYHSIRMNMTQSAATSDCVSFSMPRAVQTSPLLTLPLEIRQMVHSYIMPSSTTRFVRCNTSCCIAHTSYLRAYQQSYDEGTSFLYGQNTFAVYTTRNGLLVSYYFSKREGTFNAIRFDDFSDRNIRKVKKVEINVARGGWRGKVYYFRYCYLCSCVQIILSALRDKPRPTRTKQIIKYKSIDSA